MIKVSKYLVDCPKVWQNYIDSVNPKGILKDAEVDEITLREWNGVFKKEGKLWYVEFLTHEDEVMFMLRRSS